MSVKCTTCDKACSFRKEPFNADYATLLARHNALREAVAWERECDECGEWLHGAWWDRNELDLEEIEDLYDAARAEVDRILQEKL